jgi:hypothetical protein
LAIGSQPGTEFQQSAGTRGIITAAFSSAAERPGLIGHVGARGLDLGGNGRP